MRSAAVWTEKRKDDSDLLALHARRWRPGFLVDARMSPFNLKSTRERSARRPRNPLPEGVAISSTTKTKTLTACSLSERSQFRYACRYSPHRRGGSAVL